MRARDASFGSPLWARDGLLALFVTAMQVQGTVARTQSDPASVMRPLGDLGNLGYVLLVASGLVLAVRHRWPLQVFATTGLASVVYYAYDFPDGPGWISLFVALYTLAATGDGRSSLIAAGVGTCALAVAWLLAAADLQPRAAFGWVFFRIGACVMSAALGESVRSRRRIAVDAVRRAEEAERTREDAARARVDEERLRIAREVHDTVAHAIAVINVQAGVTAHVLDKRPDRARETLVAIEQTSARALHEMRAILGVLRDDSDGRVPHPGLAQIDDLVANAREAGLDVKLDANLPPEPVPSAVAGAAYRILQESITNIIRHVGPTRVTITVGRVADALEVSVTDEGRAAGSPRGEAGAPSAVRHASSSEPPDLPGRGIPGMRERCRLLGGEFHCSAVPEGGYVVEARLPLALTEVPHR